MKHPTRTEELTSEAELDDYGRCDYSEARKRIFVDCNIVLEIGGLTQEESVERLKEAVQSLQSRFGLEKQVEDVS